VVAMEAPPSGQAEEIVATLGVSCWSQGNSSSGVCDHEVVMFFVYLMIIFPGLPLKGRVL
jgi:hypothetical protein